MTSVLRNHISFPFNQDYLLGNRYRKPEVTRLEAPTPDPLASITWTYCPQFPNVPESTLFVCLFVLLYFLYFFYLGGLNKTVLQRA